MLGRGRFLVLSAAAGGIIALAPGRARAHCDTLAGPVITAAQAALDKNDVNLVLIWVQPADDAALRQAFAEAITARNAAGAERQAADQRFFETLVRIHRAGEGAPYTGIKPADTDVGAAVRAADQSLAAGSSDALLGVLTAAVQSGVKRHFDEVSRLRSYEPSDVAAGRAYVKAYVEYTHFAERLHDAVNAAGHGHGEAHAGAAHGAHQGAAHGGDGVGDDKQGCEHHAAAGEAGHDGAMPHAGCGAGEHQCDGGEDCCGGEEHASRHGGHGSHAAHLPWLLAGGLGIALVGQTGWVLKRKRNAP